MPWGGPRNIGSYSTPALNVVGADNLFAATLVGIGASPGLGEAVLEQGPTNAGPWTPFGTSVPPGTYNDTGASCFGHPTDLWVRATMTVTVNVWNGGLTLNEIVIA